MNKELVSILENRFKAHPHRHPNIQWEQVVEALEQQPEKARAVAEMERTGGEPDVVGDDLTFMDCSKESPSGRRSLCYDHEALLKRKKNKPLHSAMGMAEEMGVTVLDEEEYRLLQTVEAVDEKTSSWIRTPDAIRQQGGALFCDRRYGQVFTYHNGADSYYAARAFRARVRF